MVKEIGTSVTVDTWASTGTKVDPGLSKTNAGWALSERPPHEYMNWLQNQYGQKINHALSWGVARWNNENAYLTGAVVGHAGGLWLAVTDNTSSEPADANSNWQAILTGALETQAQSTWNTGTSAVESVISPAKLTARLDDYVSQDLSLGQVTWNTGTSTDEATISPAKLTARLENYVSQDLSLDQTTWDAGASTDEATISPAKLAGAVSAQGPKTYESTPRTITAGGQITFTHNLGGEPFIVQYILECVSAYAGYSSGDRVPTGYVTTNPSANSAYTNNCVITNTQIILRYDNDGVFIVCDKNTGEARTIDPNGWRLIVRAVRF